MMIPISMVLLSRILKYRANRVANLIAGSIMTVALILTLFAAVPTIYYVFFTVIEVVTTALIVWFAWRWRNTEAQPRVAPRPRGRNVPWAPSCSTIAKEENIR